MRRRVLAALLAASSFCVALAPVARAGRAPTGDRRGLALLRRVHSAYRRVPAVVTSARLGPARVSFTLVLRDGVATAEEFEGVTRAGTTLLVVRGRGPTYARDPGATCWRRLGRTDRQSLEDVGTRFPDAFRTTVERPRRSGATWLLPATTSGRFPGEVGRFTMHVDATTMLVRSETGLVRGQMLIERVRALRRRPALPVPRPVCPP